MISLIWSLSWHHSDNNTLLNLTLSHITWCICLQPLGESQFGNCSYQIFQHGGTKQIFTNFGCFTVLFTLKIIGNYPFCILDQFWVRFWWSMKCIFHDIWCSKLSRWFGNWVFCCCDDLVTVFQRFGNCTSSTLHTKFSCTQIIVYNISWMGWSAFKLSTVSL